MKSDTPRACADFLSAVDSILTIDYVTSTESLALPAQQLSEINLQYHAVLLLISETPEMNYLKSIGHFRPYLKCN
jgi:hypothetical protein